MSTLLRLGGLAAAVIVLAVAGTALILGGDIGGPTDAPSPLPSAGVANPTAPAASPAASAAAAPARRVHGVRAQQRPNKDWDNRDRGRARP